MKVVELRQYAIGGTVGVIFMIISTLIVFVLLVWSKKLRDRKKSEKNQNIVKENTNEQHTINPTTDSKRKYYASSYPSAPAPTRKISNSVYVIDHRERSENPEDPISVLQRITSDELTLHRDRSLSNPTMNRTFSGSLDLYEDAVSSQSNSDDSSENNINNIPSFVSAESMIRNFAHTNNVAENEVDDDYDGEETIKNGPAIMEMSRQLSRESSHLQDKPLWYHRNQIITQNSNTNVMFNWPTNTYRINPIFDNDNVDEYYDNENIYSHSRAMEIEDGYEQYQNSYKNHYQTYVDDVISKNGNIYGGKDMHNFAKPDSNWNDIHLHRSSPNYNIGIGKTDTLYSLQDSGFYEDMLHRSRTADGVLASS